MPELTGGLLAPEAAAEPPKFGAGAVPPASGFEPPTLGFTEVGTLPEFGAVAIPPALVPPTLGLTAPAPVAGAGACAKAATGTKVQTATENEPAIIQEEGLLLLFFDIGLVLLRAVEAANVPRSIANIAWRKLKRSGRSLCFDN